MACVTNNQQQTRDLTTGINGKGDTVWIVTTMRGQRVLGMERFTTEAEATNWLKWA